MEKIEQYINDNLQNFKLLHFYLKSEGHHLITQDFYIQSGSIDYYYQPFGNTPLKLPKRLEEFYDKLVTLVTEEDFDIDYDNYHTIEVRYTVKNNTLTIKDIEHITVTRDFSSVTDAESPEILDIFKLWFDKGFSLVKVDFNGGGDSGYIDSEGYNDSERRIEIPAALDDFLYEILGRNFGGWEINEGSQGTFDIHTDDNEIILHIGVNEEGTETSTIYTKQINF